MQVMKRMGALIGVAALLLTPTAALATGPEYAPEHPTHPTHPAHPTPGPKAPLPAKAKAYGVYCRGFSKKHVKGQKGTPFSQCVTAMAKVATAPETTSAKTACKGFSKVHVKGQKGTPFSQCVVAAAQVKKDLADASA
jgi:hypothetical protein